MPYPNGMHPASGLITGGFGFAAYEGFMTYQFHLFVDVHVHITNFPQYSAGSKPLAPGEITKLYTPVDFNKLGINSGASHLGIDPSKPPFYVPAPKHLTKDLVVMRVTLGNKTNEKEYLVPKNRARTIIKILNFANTTKKRINVLLNNFKKGSNGIKVTISKLFRRRDK